jgi:peptidoglycan/xylan/chitin deacetylase (PgdA/CDA1 family)
MKFLILLLFLAFEIQALPLGMDFHYPEDRWYTPADRGLAPYRASSLYHTGTYSLTFDDGPHPQFTAQILDILKGHGVKATFFVLTDKLNEGNFPLMKRLLDEGHILASHGTNHERAANLDELAWKEDVKRSFLKLAQIYHRAGHAFTKHYYRFPFGDYGSRQDYHHINALKDVSMELFGANCIHMAFWDIDTADWVPGMTPAEVAGNIIAHNEGGIFTGFRREGDRFVKFPYLLNFVPAGGVVLQHDVQRPSVAGTELFLQYARERLLDVVRLDEVEEFLITRNCFLKAP